LGDRPKMLAIVGGTGFGELGGMSDVESLEVETAFGSAYVERGMMNGIPLLFLPRHGHPPRFQPHKINYRANIDALIASGASHVIGVTAVGGVDASLAVPQIIIPDQVIDYTYGRHQTFYDDEIFYIDFTYPYDETLRDLVVAAAVKAQAENADIVFQDGGVYGCTQGPRLETAAEIRRLRVDGCDIVGMTAMPELALARERDLPYAGISVNVNAGAGINEEPIGLPEIHAAMTLGLSWVLDVIRHYSAAPFAASDSGSGE